RATARGIAPPRYIAYARFRHERRNAAVALRIAREQRHRMTVHLQLHTPDRTDARLLRSQGETDHSAHIGRVRQSKCRMAILRSALHERLRRHRAIAERECG